MLKLRADRRHLADVIEIDAVDPEVDEVVSGPQPVAGPGEAANEIGRDALHAHRGELVDGGTRVADFLHRIDEVVADSAHRQHECLVRRRRSYSVLLQVSREARIDAEAACAASGKVPSRAGAVEAA